jgi:uncharacterized protein YgbK (DUF1537 family)
VTRRARALDVEVVKKVDSTLRGNVAAELRALAQVYAEAGERVLLVVAPAFPATSRTTRGGVVHVDGARLAAHGSDGDVVALLQRGGLTTGGIGLDDLDDGAHLADSLVRGHGEGLDAVVVDAETDEHLETVVRAAHCALVPTVLVGSGGLTRPLAGTATAGAPTTTRTAGATLVVVGSYAQVSTVQRRRLVEHGVVPVLLDQDPEGTGERLRRVLDRGVAVLSPDPRAPVVRRDAPRVARALADAVIAVLDEVGTLVATGGETARAILTAAGVSRILVTGEVEPGIVRGHVPELGLHIVTKAGGFGDEDALLRCIEPTGSTAQKGNAP